MSVWTLTLVSHNAYWFQGAPRLWGDDRRLPHPAVVQGLGEVYARLGPDVLCLQEVPTAQAAAALGESLGMHNSFAPGAMRSEYGGAVLTRDQGAVCTDHSAAEVMPGRTFERVCMSARLTVAGRSLHVVNIHLSSDRYAPARVGEPIRLAEIATALARLPAPDVVMGDFNATPDSPVYRFMLDRGFVDAGAEWDQAPSSQRIDYTWLRRDLRGALRTYRRVEGPALMLPGSDPPRRLSDHDPVLVELAGAPEPSVAHPEG